MTTRSLLFRLSATAAILIVLALTLAAFGLRAIFNQEIDRRAAMELSQIVKVIAAKVRIDAGGALSLGVTPTDPRFDTPYGGLYWQVSAAGHQPTRSRSLWDVVLAVPEDRPDGERWATDLTGPNGSTLLAVVQDVVVPSAAGETSLQIVAALDRSDLTASQQSLFRLLVLSLVALGVILVIAMSIFIRLALRPFDDLGRGLQTIHAGESHVLGGHFPDEVQPVVDDLNRLIEFQNNAVERAKTHAADLAHGLKTPLAVLGAVARQATSDGRKDLAEPIDEQVTQMHRQVDRVLAQARAGTAAMLGRKAVAIAPAANKVVRALERLPDSKTLHWECNIASDARFPGEEGDLIEMLGNLLDNARKWAKSQIRIKATVSTAALTLRVEDDGPGVAQDRALQIARGQRWDETQPGTGFGLAITRDLAEGYRGTLALGRSELGGLSAVVTIPLGAARSKA